MLMLEQKGIEDVGTGKTIFVSRHFVTANNIFNDVFQFRHLSFIFIFKF